MNKIRLFSVEIDEKKLVEDLRRRIEYEINKKKETKEEILEKHKLKEVIFLKKGNLIDEKTVELCFEGSTELMKYLINTPTKLDTKYGGAILSYCEFKYGKIIFNAFYSINPQFEEELQKLYNNIDNELTDYLLQLNKHIRSINEKSI